MRQPSASNEARLVARHSGGGKIPAKACKHDAENGDFCQVEKLSDAHRSFGSSNSKYSEYLCSLANIVICCTQMAG